MLGGASAFNARDNYGTFPLFSNAHRTSLFNELISRRKNARDNPQFLCCKVYLSLASFLFAYLLIIKYLIVKINHGLKH